MSETRPSGIPVLQDSDAVVIQEVSHVDERGRLRVVGRWAEHAKWGKPASKAPSMFLMVLDRPGRLFFEPWELSGPAIEERSRELADADPPDYEGIRRIQDRYNKLQIPSDNRASLGEAAMRHLGLDPDLKENQTVYVSIRPGRIDVLSVERRTQELETKTSALEDLP